MMVFVSTAVRVLDWLPETEHGGGGPFAFARETSAQFGTMVGPIGPLRRQVARSGGKSTFHPGRGR